MKRLMIIAGILVVLAAGVPAHAAEVRGSVAVAVVHPTVPNAAWSMDPRSNGVTGYVFRLGPQADGRSYMLETISGATGFDNVDAYFYEDRPDGSGPGAPCTVRVTSEDIHSETGVICPGPQRAAWGIVVLAWGANARFRLTY